MDKKGQSLESPCNFNRNLFVNIQVRSYEMYPSLDAPSAQMTFKKQVPPSEAMTNAILELTKNFAIASFKPHLNYHECYLSLIISGQVSYPIKLVFLRNFPKEKPIIYITKWVQHPLVKAMTCEIDYESFFKWNEASKLVDLIRKIQQEFSKSLPSEKTDIDKAYVQLDDYLKQVESLRNKPPGTQPPPPPQISLQNILKTFEYQEHLYTQCQEKNQLYLITAQEYSQNVSRVRCISERFGKGKILRELEKELEKQVAEVENGKIDDLVKKYYESRKQYHRIKILKELYLEN